MTKRRGGPGPRSVVGNSNVTLRMSDTIWFAVCDEIRVQHHSLYSDRDSWKRLNIPISDAVYWSAEGTPFPLHVIQSFLEEAQDGA